MTTDKKLDRLIEQARRLGKHRTKREAVTAALRHYIQYRKQLRRTGRCPYVTGK